ncbi:MAG: FecR domain-containing protein [Bdellovibrio sp.]|nr:FecR domain-containing protein [Bdellovibrio sp.]
MSKLDRRLIVICLICIGGVSYLISHPELITSGQGEEKDSIGQVIKVTSDIRRKSKQEYFWEKAYENTYVSKNDTIYTGAQSSAEIKLNDGKVLQISQNSLIRFTTINKNISIDLAFGQVAATGVDKTFIITDCGKQYTVDAKDASFQLTKNKDCGNFDLKVSKGTVLMNKKPVQKATPKRVEAKNILVETQEENKIQITKLVQLAKPIEPVLPSEVTVVPDMQPAPAPVVEEKIVLDNPRFVTQSKKMLFKDGVRQHLEWQSVPKADFYTLETADNEQFLDAQATKVIDTHYDFQPPKGGDYYFKVKAVSMSGVESNPSQALQIALTYPSIQLKNKLITAQYKAKSSKDPGQRKNFNVGWTTVDSADKYVVEVDRDPRFSKPMTLVSRTPSSVIPVAKPGNVHYRVSAYDKTGRKISSTSSPGEIDYRKVFNMAQPVLEHSLKNMSYYFQKDFAQYIWLKWNSPSADDRKKYRLELSKTPDFKQISSAFATTDRKFLIKNKLDRGEYFWRVRSENESQFSDWSDLGRFKITTRN